MEVALETGPDHGYDAQIDAYGRHWLFAFKSSSSPGIVAAAAAQLERQGHQGLQVLVVPFMTPGGARTAAERGLNWIDLSGNADVRDEQLRLLVQGQPNQFASVGRPSSPFAPKSSRVARVLLLDPERWWRQKELAAQTDLDPSRISRVVRALDAEQLLDRDGPSLRPRDPGALLDAWSDDYRFDRHDVVSGHLSGSGVELARELDGRLGSSWSGHAMTGLAAAWQLDGFARFRLVSVYVDGDPRGAADAAGVRLGPRGANVQLVGPDDRGVFDGASDVGGVQCAAAPQVLLDLGQLPERSGEAAEHLRAQLGWR